MFPRDSIVSCFHVVRRSALQSVKGRCFKNTAGCLLYIIIITFHQTRPRLKRVANARSHSRTCRFLCIKANSVPSGWRFKVESETVLKQMHHADVSQWKTSHLKKEEKKIFPYYDENPQRFFQWFPTWLPTWIFVSALPSNPSQCQSAEPQSFAQVLCVILRIGASVHMFSARMSLKNQSNTVIQASCSFTSRLFRRGWLITAGNECFCILKCSSTFPREH